MPRRSREVSGCPARDAPTRAPSRASRITLKTSGTQSTRRPSASASTAAPSTCPTSVPPSMAAYTAKGIPASTLSPRVEQGEEQVPQQREGGVEDEDGPQRDGPPARGDAVRQHSEQRPARISAAALA